MEDFWPNFTELSPFVNNSLKILCENAEVLPRRTNNKVKALFSKTQYKKVSASDKSYGFLDLTKFVGGNKEVEVQEAELENKQDANRLFSNEEYKFVIYNDFYRFSVLKLKYNIVYPVTIIVDEDIAKELTKDPSVEINNDMELKDLLKAVFNSKKMIAIITHIMSISFSEEDKS